MKICGHTNQPKSNGAWHESSFSYMNNLIDLSHELRDLKNISSHDFDIGHGLGASIYEKREPTDVFNTIGVHPREPLDQ
jgi:hypothetical protein